MRGIRNPQHGTLYHIAIVSNYTGERSTCLGSKDTIYEMESFNVKEHVMVTIFCASGAMYNLAWIPISLSELYFGNRIEPTVCLFFMWAVVWIGYLYVALAR